MNSPDITLSLVSNLIKEQFPQWAHLPIRPVELSGWDNRTFRLGEQMSIRLPSAEYYAAKVFIEQRWLPVLAPQLSIPIPQPIAMGKPSEQYPWHWSIYRWIEGTSANALALDDSQLSLLAFDLVQFLNELHMIDTTLAPLPGSHNGYRGAHPSVYDAETKAVIAMLHNVIDADAATAVWERALQSTWTKKPVWIHGDMSAGNILIKDGRLAGVIDFGGMGVGDPACDLVIAWTVLTYESRKIFTSKLCLDPDTWARACGWALWKALITLERLQDAASLQAQKIKHIIQDILNEHEL
jgi:aminoglycoside phosphotransferase (APT) family kinase protein